MVFEHPSPTRLSQGISSSCATVLAEITCQYPSKHPTQKMLARLQGLVKVPPCFGQSAFGGLKMSPALSLGRGYQLGRSSFALFEHCSTPRQHSSLGRAVRRPQRCIEHGQPRAGGRVQAMGKPKAGGCAEHRVKGE